MRTLHRLLVIAAASLSAGAAPSAPAEGADTAAIARLRARIDAAEAAVADAAAALAGARAAEARAALAQADAEAAGGLAAASEADVASELGRSRGRVVAALGRLRARVAAASAAAPDEGADARVAARRLRRAADAVRDAIRPLRLRGGEAFEVAPVARSSGTFGRPGDRRRFRVVPRACGDAAVVTVSNDVPGRAALRPDVVARGRGRFDVRWGSDLGTARIDVTSCGTTRTQRCVNLGVPRALATSPPAGDSGAVLYARSGTPVTSPVPFVSGDGPFAFTVEPPLPERLSFDLRTGALSGTPAVAGPATTHRITASNLRGIVALEVSVDVDPALPAGVADAAGGFAVDLVADDLAIPVKLARTPDGRVLYGELLTGAVRVIDPSGALLDAPFAVVPVTTGVERGLQGIAVAPDFATSGRVYVFASTAAGDGKPERNRVLRYTEGPAGVAGPDVIVDDLPIAGTQNGGGLAFGPDGKLYVTTGDAGVSEDAQRDGSLAGRVLRYDPDGGVPADNPVPGSPEWARGFRNPFGIAFSPAAGDLFVTENGPDAHDELDFVQPGRNFGWGAPEDAHFGALTGVRVVDWTPVIAPTGIAFHDGTSFGAEYAGNAFVGSYDRACVLRIVLAGVDFESEAVLLQFDPEEFERKPLDVLTTPDGGLLVSTFSAIYRVRRD